MIRKLHVVGLVVAASAASAHAVHAETGLDPGDEVDGDEGHVMAITAWSALELAIPAWYYWHTQKQQEVDWTRPSWKDKLTLHSLRFDTNAFHVNAIRHPLAGIGDYQITRSNGFGALESTLFAYLAGAVWELGIEYYEDPAINDLIMNGAGGLAIGEPLYQIGQLWRSSDPSPSDRLRTVAFSPFAATQDLWRTHRVWPRRRAWSDFAFIAGAVGHRLDGGAYRRELAFGLDIDLVRHAGFVVPGPHDGLIAPGAWSRIALGLWLGDLGTGSQPVATMFRSRTAIAGTYTQDDTGNGRLLAIGAAFTYRRDRLAREWDHLAIAHLLGPQLQLTQHGGEDELRWDLAAYGDFGLVDAHVFGPVSPLPPPPPYLSTLQAQGYYDAAGASIESRVRADLGAWHADLEVTGHRLWSLDFADRLQPTADISRIDPTSATASAVAVIPRIPHGMSDLRVYGHAELGVRQGTWGIAATADTAYRSGRWRNLERTTSDWMVGILTTANY